MSFILSYLSRIHVRVPPKSLRSTGNLPKKTFLDPRPKATKHNSSLKSLSFFLGSFVLGCSGPGTPPDADVGIDVFPGTDVVNDLGQPDATDVTTPPDQITTDGGTCGVMLGMCNLISSAGCSAGRACLLVGVQTDAGTQTTTVCAAPGTGGYGTACGGTTSNACLEGFICLRGQCTKLCCGLGDDQRCRTGTGGMPGAFCDDGELQSSSGTRLGVSACVLPTRCDWFNQDCPNAQNCIAIRADGTTQCVAAGTGQVGANCTNGCARGLQCVEGFCRKICDPSLPITNDAGTVRNCPSGSTCSPLQDSPADYGACVPP